MKRSTLLILLVVLATGCSRSKAPLRVSKVTSSSPQSTSTPSPTPSPMQNQTISNPVGPRVTLNVQNAIDFPIAFPNRESNFTVIINNTGDANATVPVSVSGAGLRIRDTSCGALLAPRASCQINLIFSGESNRAGQLRIGEITLACNLRIQAPQVRLLTLNENVLADGFTFTTIPVNTTETRAFLLRNLGNAPADLPGLSLRGSTSFTLSSVADCTAKYPDGKLPPQGICAVEVRYAPAAPTNDQEGTEMIFQTPWNEVRARLFGRAFPAVRPMNVVWGLSSGHHIYTTADGERDYLRTHGFTDGLDLPNTQVTIPFFYHTEQVAGTVPVYRLSHRDGQNIMTLDLGHRNGLINGGDWTLNSQAPAFLYPTQPPSERIPTNPVFHLYLHANGDHYYTEDVFERDSLKSRGWDEHSILGYAPVFYARAETFNVATLPGGAARVAWSAPNAEDCSVVAWTISATGTVESSGTPVINGPTSSLATEFLGLRPSGGNRLLLRCRVGLPTTNANGLPARIFNVHQILFQN